MTGSSDSALRQQTALEQQTALQEQTIQKLQSAYTRLQSDWPRDRRPARSRSTSC